MIQKRQPKQNNGKKRTRSALARTGRNVALCAMCIGAAFSSVSRVSGKSVAELTPSPAASSYALSSTAVGEAQSDALFLPGSYEQYLPLENPASVAVTHNYTAIADGLKIYIYDRAENEYRYYAHEIVGDTQITQLKFDGTETLYFSAQGSTHLYSLNVNTLASTDTQIACSAFEIYGDDLYYTTISGTEASISVRSLSNLATPRAPLKESVLGKPAIAHNGETLYYTVGEMLAAVGQTGAQTLAPTAVQSMTFYADYCYYTDTNKNLYAFRYADSGAQSEKIAQNCTAVSSAYEGCIYVVGDKKIRQLNAETRQFTAYEISASSSSEGRLYAATDTTLCGKNLITLDGGNAEENVPARIHVTAAPSEQSAQTTRSFALSDLAGKAKRIASDGETACVVSSVTSSEGESGTLSVYDLTAEKLVFSYSAEVGEPFVGVACVYGTYYAASKTRFYKIAPTPRAAEDEKQYTVESRSCRRANELLAADVYGTLYVAQSDKNVYAYTESDFVSETATPQAAAELPQNGGTAPSKLLVDFHRNVYVLQGGALVRCAAPSADDTPAAGDTVSYPMNGKLYVYTQTQETPVISAAFGVETKATYVLYNGNFIAASYDLPLPTVHSIAVDGADETLFSQSAAEFCVTECAENTLLLHIDLSALHGAEYFPCVSYRRTEKKIAAITLAETQTYALLAVYDEAENGYYTALAEKNSCESVSESEFLTTPPEPFASGAKGYVTNAISLYKYPYLTPLLTVCPLDKNAEVTVLRTVRKLDWEYYLVEYTDENGATQTGFLPAAYVSETNGTAPQAQTTVLGEENANRDLIWRLVYIVLGTLVVCILTDYLILRKNDRE